MENLVLNLRPGQTPLSWQSFRRSHPYYSIALDGYVRGKSRYDAAGPWLTLDHHEDVERLSSRATCSQVLLSLRQGLLETFRDDRGPYAHVYANDCDEDVCVSWFLLQHPSITYLPSHRRLERLIHAADWLDTTAGALVHPLDDGLMGEMSWIFAPFREARMSGLLESFQANVYREVIDDVGRRISDYLQERGGQLPLDLRFERLGGNAAWALVREVGKDARAGLVRAGIRAYVAVRPRQDGSWAYTVGRVSPFVPFDVPTIVARLNEAEGARRGPWGGGNLVAGSPRLSGSRLSPAQVEKIVNRAVSGATRRARHQAADSSVTATVM